MPASLQVEVPPLVEPVSLATAKAHLRVSITNDDTLIGVYIQAARELVETYLARSLVNKGYRQSHDFFPYFSDRSQTMTAPAYYASSPRYATTQWNYSQMIKLQVSPLVSVESIEYVKTDGTIGILLPALQPWRALTQFTIGNVVQDSNGNAQKATTVTPSGIDGSGKSGATVPGWATALNGTTTDGDITWTCQGAAPLGDFVVDTYAEPGRLFPIPGKNWPATLNTPNAVRIHFTAGYGNISPQAPSGAATSAFPAVAKLAILQAVANWYENRENVTDATMKEIPFHFEALLWSIRVLDMAPTPG